MTLGGSGSEFHEDLVAELAALNMAVQRALLCLAALSGDRRNFLMQLLEAGDRDLAQTKFYSVPPERQAAVIEKARARYMDLVAGMAGSG